MTFRDPLTSLAADAITSGTFTGTYRNTGTFVLAGTPGASRIEASGTELAFYATDGTTKLIDLDTASGAGVIRSTEIDGATITGGLVQTAAAPSNRVYLDGTNNRLGLSPTLGAANWVDAYLLAALETELARQAPQLEVVGPNSPGVAPIPPALVLRGTDPTGVRVPTAILSAPLVQVDRGNGIASLYARDDLLIAAWAGTAGSNGQVTVDFPSGAFSTAPLVLVQAIAGFSQWVVSATTTASFTLTTRGSTGTAPAVGTALSGIYLAALP